MNCRYPVTIYDKVHNKNIQVPCGKCVLCCASKARDWQNRLKLEFDYRLVCYFVTLTYDDDNLPYMQHLHARNTWLKTSSLDEKLSHLCTIHNTNYRTNDLQMFNHDVPSLNPKDLTNYFKKLRINISRDYEKDNQSISIKYFAIGEYGPQTFRPHYHCIIGVNIDNITPHEFMRYLINQNKRDTEGTPIRSIRHYFANHITKAWDKGYAKIGDLNEERIQYCTKYVYKFSDAVLIDYFARFPGIIQPFKRSSNGIGASFVDRNTRYLTANNRLTIHGHTNRVPRYMREKVKSKLNEDDLKKYEDFISFTPEKEEEHLRKKLDYYCALTHTPMHSNIYDEDFQHWLDMHEVEKINKIKRSFKKRIL